MPVVRMQHYVPRSYLRRFADKHHRLHAFDKKTLRSIFTHVDNLAQERDFYDLPPQVVKETGADPKLFEGGFGRLVDDRLMKEVHQFTKIEPDSPIALDNRVHVAQFIVFQYSRTRTVLNLAIELQKTFVEGLMDQMVMMNRGQEGLKHRPTYVIEEQYVAAQLWVHAFDEEKSKPKILEIVHREWVLAKTTCEHPFYTSDSPAVLQVIGSPRAGVGLLSLGTRIVLPLSPLLCLIVMERPLRSRATHHKDWCIHRPMNNKQVDALNRLQVCQSGRWVFGGDGGFDLAREICEVEPVVRDPKPRRVSVRHGVPYHHADGTVRSTIEAILGTPDSPPADDPIPVDFEKFGEMVRGVTSPPVDPPISEEV